MTRTQTIGTIGNAAQGALTVEQLTQTAPSLFAEQAAPGASAKYQFVKTIDVMATLAKVGYLPVKAGQAKARTPDGKVYCRHVVRMMHEDHVGGIKRAGDVVPQIILQNSHNRTSAFHLSAGLYRLVCSNGLAVGAGDFASVRVLHNDPAIHDHIIAGAKHVQQFTGEVVFPQIDRMKAHELTEAQTIEFAEAATFLKFGEVRPDHVAHMLEVRREEDAARNMWTVLNRIQENAVKAGYATKDKAGRNVTQKGIESIARDTDFNMNLWSLGARVLEAA